MSDYLIYHQKNGVYETSRGGEVRFLCLGWAGHGEGKNNPEKESVRELGPLPKGWYTILPPENHPDTVGPYALRLIPDPENKMYGRDSFLIHGPAVKVTVRGQESKGCPIANRWHREKIWNSGLRRLQVVE